MNALRLATAGPPTALRTAVVLCSLCLPSSPALAQAPPAPTRSGPLFHTEEDAPPPVTPPPAAPPSRDARLAYTRGPGAESCPDEAAFRNAVAANVGRDPFTASAPRLATVTIQREGGMFVARMDLRNAAGAQEWAHDPLARADCRDLVRVMGLSIAIPIDPFPAHPAPPPGARTEPPASATLLLLPSPPPGEPDRQPSPGAAATPTERPRIRLGVRAGVAAGTAPEVTAAFAVQVGVRWPLASVSIEGQADIPVDGPGNLVPMTRVSAGLFAGALVPCAHIPLPARFNVPICGVLTVGAIDGTGLSVNVPMSGLGLYVAAGGRAGLEIPVNDAGTLALRVDGDLLGAIVPAAITLNGQQAWTTGRVSGGGAGGVRFDF